MKRAYLFLVVLLAVPAGFGGPPTAAPAKLSFELLKSWVYDEERHTPIPKSITQFEGQQVELSGYMMPMTEIKNIKEFLFVPSLWGCCYGQPAAINHLILGRMPRGKTSKFYPDRVTIRGVFRCGEIKDNGYVLSLYRIEVEAIVPE